MKPEEKDKTFKLIDSLKPLEVTKEIVACAYQVKNASKGFNLGLYDCIIAASAKIKIAALITKNIRHFPMDDILKIRPY